MYRIYFIFEFLVLFFTVKSIIFSFIIWLCFKYAELYH
jgi:hypothetical protein